MDGVLCAYDFEGRLARLERDLGVPAKTILAEIFGSGFEDDADLGRMTADAYIAGISERLGVPVTAEKWLAARKAAMTPDAEMLALARSLRDRGIEIAMLTNNGRLLAEHIDQVMPDVVELFGPRMFFSAVIGMGKEHADTFPKFIAMLGWDIGSTLFVDDSAHYIEAASSTGIRTHHFKGIAGLRSALAAYGL